MNLDPNKTYLTWNGSEFPNSSSAKFKAPAGSSIDWGDGTVETFETASETVNTHTYTDSVANHIITISGLTNVTNGSFSVCSGLTNITIGNSVTSIGSSAFYNCSRLMSVTIPDSVIFISGSTFENCTKLVSVTIGNRVPTIGSYAFYNCSNLKQLILFPSSPPTLGSNALPANVQSIYVQQSSKAAYQAATNWTTFASKIVGDNIYLSFVRFNQKNKEYINEKINNAAINVVQTTGNSETDVMSQKAATDNFARLVDGKVPESQLPSYVDDVVEYDSNSAFPATGEEGKIYVDKSTNLTYRWSGSTYIQVGGGDLALENGTGDVLIQTTDSNPSFKVMGDGRAKVRSAPVEDDDVVRNKELAERSFAYYSIEAETARDYSKGSKIDKMFKDILKRIETIENKLV